MYSLTDFLTTLPGIKPRKAREALISSILIAEAKNDLHERDSYYGTVTEVGPVAALAILTAYKDGRLPMQKGETPTAAPAAEEYIAKSDEISREINDRQRRDKALRDLSLIRESDFPDDTFLNNIFFEHLGKGEGTLTLDGIEVTKTLSGYKSNSGKSTGWSVTFSWTGRDGQHRHSGWTSPQASNRRNDADRNWGLGRE